MLVVLSVGFVGVLALFCALQVIATLTPKETRRRHETDPEELVLQRLHALAEARRAHVEAMRIARYDELRRTGETEPSVGIGVRGAR